MAETEKRILATINQALQKMTDGEKERLLSFSEGMAYMAMNARTQPAARGPAAAGAGAPGIGVGELFSA